MDLCVIEGDGIGHEVVPAAVRVLQTVAPDVVVKKAEAGWDSFIRQGNSLPDETLRLALECGAVLFGAAASPSYPVDGYYVPIVRLRRELRTFASLRPTHYLPVPTARPGVDLLVIREATEDLYIGHEHTEDEGRTGISEKVITRTATENVARTAYQLAQRDGRKKITVVHKASVLMQSDGLFRRVALEVGAQFPQIATEELLVDTAAYWMVKDPTRFDIVLTPNLYGDILSDMAAAWGGGLGLAPSLSLGDTAALAEPVHGCAPDIAGKGIANPTATILSAAMLLRHHWHRHEAALNIENAVKATLEEGAHTADISSEDAISTWEFTDKVCKHLV
ncbi:MAG TPA: isocitrate/isopropylmalate dehydrogenase family protein [Phototrophicaceae bacterium]|nr:isocitrate/isopropylmalate dehydrogenase family protein [Phototrophicaceae bacterium]